MSPILVGLAVVAVIAVVLWIALGIVDEAVATVRYADPLDVPYDPSMRD